MNIPTFKMAGKVVLITGGRTGIGKALAIAFAEAGADVAVCSRTVKGGELEAVAGEIRKLGRRALAIRADVSDKADVENMVSKTVAELGDIDILINNAGISQRSLRLSLLETEEEVWDKVIDINLKGAFLCSQVVGRLMVERRKGNIINIASTGGLRPSLNRTAYSVSKAGLIMLTRVLARELGNHNIRVNAIAPWIIETPITADMRSNIGTTDITLAKVPLGRIGETDDIVGAALFLASDAAGWITGHTIVIDGGCIA